MGQWGDRLTGLIFILIGIYLLLCGYRILPWKPKNADKAEVHYRKYGRIEKIIGFVIICYGIKELLGL